MIEKGALMMRPFLFFIVVDYKHNLPKLQASDSGDTGDCKSPENLVRDYKSGLTKVKFLIKLQVAIPGK